MCRKAIRFVKKFNSTTGSANFEAVAMFILAAASLVSGLIMKNILMILLGAVIAGSGTHFFFMPWISYRYPKLHKIDTVSMFFVIPIGSFFIGVLYCSVYFIKPIETYLLISYTISAIMVSLLIGGLYLRDAINHLRNINEDKINIFFLLLELIQVIHFFAIVYSVIFIIDNSGFSGINSANAFSIYLDMFYFSTVTFTTLGFGDILPISPFAKLTVIFEVFLFAVIISLIVVNVTSKSKKESARTLDPKGEIKEKHQDAPN